MPPVHAGAGQIPGHGRGAPTATALAGVARHKLALHLPADATFRHELENKLHLQPFRGIVTGVTRDSSGTNNVFITRTGQLHADPAPYPVFASKLIPIVGDEVLLEYVAGSPTAMVTQARKGGRPDEQDVPWSGGSRRMFDSARALIRKHRDDHNSAHYRANGTTVAHVTGENGDHNSIGDKYHNVGTITEAGGKSGGYQRHTRQSGRYENRHHDGSLERIATHAEEVSGDHGLYFNGTMHVNHTPSGNGAKTRHKQHGSSLFHESGEDGFGNYQEKHASGVVMVNHTGASMSMAVSGSNVLTHTGSQLAHWVGNRTALTHNGASVWLGAGIAGAVLMDALTHDGVTHAVHSNNRTVVQHSGSGLGGQMLVADSAGGQHLVRESTTGYLEHISTGGEMHLKTSGAGGNQHLLDGNQHKFPSTTKLSSQANDSSRIDVLSGAGGGAIKAASHSTTTIIDTFSGVTFPSGTGAAGLLFQRAGPSGTSLTGLIFKAQALQVYNGGNGNPQKYKVPAVGNGAASLGGTPVKTDSSGTEDSAHYWQVQNHYADGSLDVYGTNIGTGAPAYSVWATIQHIIVNA